MYQTFIKRLLDFVLAATTLVLAFPIFILCALIIKLNDGGPVLFKHQRFGRHKKPFTVYKFRSMVTTAPRNAPTNSLTDAASYITTPGRVMRKLSLDELPQLVNVLKGEMSMVGPRPVVLKETDLIQERQKYDANAVLPGITGWAQVNGRDEVEVKTKAKMDGHYARNISFFMDLKCILMTFWAVVSVKGHREGDEMSGASEGA